MRHTAKNINGRIAAEISWARTHDRAARTRPARETFLKRFEKEVDPDGTMPPEERRQRAEHAKRAYMLQLAKRSAAARKAKQPASRSTVSGHPGPPVSTDRDQRDQRDQREDL